MNKIIFISNVTTPQRAYENEPRFKDFDIQFFTMNDSADKIVSSAPDTEFIILDAMAKCGEDIIGRLPKLRLIHSEGVGYQGIDMESAERHGVAVCNNKGINDTAVAECTVLHILGCLKGCTAGSNAVYTGRQMEAKAQSFGVVRELSECTVGLVGFGDIAKASAKLLSVFGCRVLYANRTRYEEQEKEYNVQYCSLDELLENSDFVSLHLAVNEDTKNIVDTEFLRKMKTTAYLINTSRGELVDNEALVYALKNGVIAGAGLDVIAPEPVTDDNILLDEKIREKLFLTPHIAGITSLTVNKIYRNCYENIMRVINGKTPLNKVL